MMYYSTHTRNTQAVADDQSPADYLRVAFQLSPRAMVLIDQQDYTIIDANPAAVKLLSPDDDGLEGRSFLHCIPGEEAWKAFADVLWDGYGGGSGGPAAEITVHQPDGAIRTLALRCNACLAERGPKAEDQNAILLQIEDVSARCQAEQELTGAAGAVGAAGHVHLVECIGDGFFVLDRQGKIIFANSAGERILRASREQFLGRRLSQVLPEIDERLIEKILKKGALADTHSHSERVPLCLEGEQRQLEISLHPHHDGMGVLFRDISERVSQEQRIAMLNVTMTASQELLRRKNEELNISLEQVNLMNNQLAEADRLKSEFLVNTSHELRTPLNSVIGFLQLISEGLCDSREEELDYVRNAMASSQQLLALINDVLDIAKIEAGKMLLLIDNVSIEELFQEVYSQTHVQAHQKGLLLRMGIRDEACAWVRVDFHKAKQILVKLISNSTKFTESGTIEVWAEPDPQRPDLMRLSVCDTGIGIPLDRQQVIFDKFMQIDGTSTRKYQGSGLGLAITKNMVEMMGGTVAVHSEGEGCGTTMYFTLPLGKPQQVRGEATPFELDELDEVWSRRF